MNPVVQLGDVSQVADVCRVPYLFLFNFFYAMLAQFIFVYESKCRLDFGHVKKQKLPGHTDRGA